MQNTAWNSWGFQERFNLEMCIHGGNCSSLAGSCWGSHMQQALDPRLCCHWLSAPGRVALHSDQSWPWFEFVVSHIFAFFIISSRFSVASRVPQTKSGLLDMLNENQKSRWRNGRAFPDSHPAYRWCPWAVWEQTLRQRHSLPRPWPQWTWKSQVFRPTPLTVQSHPKTRVTHNV